jgi:hypothetical protein
MLKFRRKPHALVCLALCASLSMSARAEAKSPRKRHKQRATLEFISAVGCRSPRAPPNENTQAESCRAEQHGGDANRLPVFEVQRASEDEGDEGCPGTRAQRGETQQSAAECSRGERPDFEGVHVLLY